MEDCQDHMTELRKERIEVNRELKRMYVAQLGCYSKVSFVILNRFKFRMAERLDMDRADNDNDNAETEETNDSLQSESEALSDEEEEEDEEEEDM